MKITCISDTHGLHEGLQIEPSELLICSGDISDGKDNQVWNFLYWMARQPAQYKILVHGNHDRKAFEKHADVYKKVAWEVQGIHILYDELLEIRPLNLRIFGSPLNYCRENKGYVIPDCDILVTHEPAYGILDQVGTDRIRAGEDPLGHLGSQMLLQCVQHRKPRLHQCGHVHEGYGIFQTEATKFVNAAVCDPYELKLKNQPIIIDL
jgi:predicted phosphodiesterase